MPTQSVTSEPEYITFARGRKMLGVSPATFRKLADEGRLSTRRVPGGWPRVKRSDVEGLLIESTRLATVGSGEGDGR
jgi:excisionase family DNA binding protein